MSKKPPGFHSGATRVLALGLIVASVAGCRERPVSKRDERAQPAARVASPRPSASASSVRSDAAISAPAKVAPSAGPVADTPVPATLAEQRAGLLSLLAEHHGADARALSAVEKIFEASDWLGQGNPKARRPAMTQKECREIRSAASSPREASPVCRAANMVAVYDPSSGQTEKDARVCIDQYEFPNVPCEYPVVWVRASEAAAICKALGKRLCDAHEWEGACAGRLLGPEEEYSFEKVPRAYDRGLRKERRLWMEHRHNEGRDIVWAYGAVKDHGKCATGARKDPRCTVVDWGICGTNSYPAGAFPECVSPFGAYDLHGNVAEHMSLPLYPNELGSRGGVGWTEMKGSWFLFQREETHPDDCRWRARNWHTTRVDHWNSHRNYHLGFRCCRDIEPEQ